jgi:hypothetical protein
MYPTPDFMTKEDTLCSEEYFHRTLVLERKKTERYGRPFLLVFLDVGALLKESLKPREIVVDGLAAALNAATRDIDVKGWYRPDTLIGIICTDVTKSDGAAMAAKIKARVGADLSPDEVRKIKVYVIHYPDYEGRTNPNADSNSIRELMPERKGMFFS